MMKSLRILVVTNYAAGDQIRMWLNPNYCASDDYYPAVERFTLSKNP